MKEESGVGRRAPSDRLDVSPVCQCRHVFQGGGQSVERGGGERGLRASHAGGAAPLRNTSRCAPRQRADTGTAQTARRGGKVCDRPVSTAVEVRQTQTFGRASVTD